MHEACTEIEERDKKLVRKDEMRELLTPIKSIRQKCIDCSGGSLAEVRFCPATECYLWHYRMGKRPRKAIAVDEQSLSANNEAQTKEKENLKQSTQLEKVC